MDLYTKITMIYDFPYKNLFYNFYMFFSWLVFLRIYDDIPNACPSNNTGDVCTA